MAAIIATAIVSIAVSVTASAAIIIKITGEAQKYVLDFLLKEFDENSKMLVQSYQGLDEIINELKSKIG